MASKSTPKSRRRKSEKAKASKSTPKAPRQLTRKDIALVRRLNRPQRKKLSDREIIKMRRRAQLIDLFRYRYGPTLPDDDGGRDDLLLLIELGLTDKEAVELAPWLTRGELSRLIGVAESGRGERLSAAAIGERVGLKFDEYLGLETWHIQPADCSAEKIKESRRERRKANDKKRQREKRARDNAAKKAAEKASENARSVNISARARAVHGWLCSVPKASTKQIAAAMSGHSSFGSLSGASLMRAVRRAVTELDEAGLGEREKFQKKPIGNLRRTTLFASSTIEPDTSGINQE